MSIIDLTHRTFGPTIREYYIGLIDAMEWAQKKGSDIKQFAINLGGKNADEFYQLLASKLSESWNPCGTAMCIEIGEITISHYIDSSYQGPALQITMPGGLKFKIRLK